MGERDLAVPGEGSVTGEGRLAGESAGRRSFRGPPAASPSREDQGLASSVMADVGEVGRGPLAGWWGLACLPKLPVLGRAPDACELLERLLASVGDEVAFFDSIEVLADWFGAHVMAVHEFDQATMSGRLVAVRGFEPGAVREYRERFAQCNVWHTHSGHAVREGGVVVSHLMYPDSKLVHSEWYTDFLRPLGALHSMGAVLASRSGRTVTTPILRERSTGNFTDDEQTVLGRLVPHLERLFRLHTRLLTAEALAGATNSALDHLPTPVILLDAELRVVAANLAARQLVAARDGVSTWNSRLTFRAPGVREELRRCVRRLADGQPIAGGLERASLRVERPSGRRAYVGEVVPLSSTVEGSTGGMRAIVALFLSDPEVTASCDCEVMRRLFGLSPTEANLVALLASGARLDVASAELGVAMSTAKTLLGRAFAKTGVSRQGDLIRLVLGSPATLRRPT